MLIRPKTNIQLTLAEVMHEVHACKNAIEVSEVLLKYKSTTLNWFINQLFVVGPVDMTVPSYESIKGPYGAGQHTFIYNRLNELESCFNNLRIDAKRRSYLLGNVLSVLHGDDAELIVGLIRGRVNVSRLTRNAVKIAYPELFESDMTPDNEVSVTSLFR